MRSMSAFTIVGLVSMAMVALFFGAGYAQQAPVNSSPVAVSAAAQTDTVVSPWDLELRVPVTNVRWRGGHWGRSFHRGSFYRPYRLYRPYAFYSPYAYSYYYRYPSRCWWNGYRWVCGRRAIIY
jgi:hypothetical protein